MTRSSLNALNTALLRIPVLRAKYYDISDISISRSNIRVHREQQKYVELMYLFLSRNLL
jgi:hypothetical protein